MPLTLTCYGVVNPTLLEFLCNDFLALYSYHTVSRDHFLKNGLPVPELKIKIYLMKFIPCNNVFFFFFPGTNNQKVAKVV